MYILWHLLNFFSRYIHIKVFLAKLVQVTLQAPMWTQWFAWSSCTVHAIQQKLNWVDTAISCSCIAVVLHLSGPSYWLSAATMPHLRMLCCWLDCYKYGFFYGSCSFTTFISAILNLLPIIESDTYPYHCPVSSHLKMQQYQYILHTVCDNSAQYICDIPAIKKVEQKFHTKLNGMI